MDYTKLFYFDIETTGKFNTYTDLKLNNIREAHNFKKRYERRGNTTMIEKTVDESYRQNAMFFAEYALTISFSYGYYNKGSFIIKSISLDGHGRKYEAELIKKINDVFIKVDEIGLIPCGQNIKGFDIPFLYKKFLEYNLRIPECIKTLDKKPWEIMVVDTTTLWKSSGWDTSSIDEIGQTLGLDNPKDDIDGSQVWEIFWDEKDINRIERYCEKDVKILPEIVEHIYRLNYN